MTAAPPPTGPQAAAAHRAAASSRAVTASLRRIAALALPALVVLAAEPLYVLVDTAVVGHLGRYRAGRARHRRHGHDRRGLARHGARLRHHRPGRPPLRRRRPGRRGRRGRPGVLARARRRRASSRSPRRSSPARSPRALAGGDAEVADAAAQWLRIAALGAPGLLLATAGNGWMRGVQDTRRPLVYVLGAEPALGRAVPAARLPGRARPGRLGHRERRRADPRRRCCSPGRWSRERVPLRPAPGRDRRSSSSLGRDLLLRGAAFQACFLSATAVAARFGTAALAAHQIALQLWMFCALVLDAVAIAAQSLVGAALGAGAGRRARAGSPGGSR